MGCAPKLTVRFVTAVPAGTPGKSLYSGGAEPDHIAGFGGCHVGAEYGSIRHAIEAEKRAVEVGDGNCHFGRGARWQADDGARYVCGCYGVHDDFVDITLRERGACIGTDQVSLRRQRACGCGRRCTSLRRCRAEVPAGCVVWFTKGSAIPPTMTTPGGGSWAGLGRNPEFFAPE